MPKTHKRILVTLLALLMLVPAAFADGMAVAEGSYKPQTEETAQKLRALYDEYQGAGQKVDEAQAVLAAAQAEVDEAQAKIAPLDEALAAATKAVEDKQGEIAGYQSMIEQLDQALALYESYNVADATYVACKAAEEEANAALDAALQRLLSANAMLEEMQYSLDVENEGQKDLAAASTAAAEALAGKEKVVSTAKVALETLQKAKTPDKAKITTAEKALETAKADAATATQALTDADAALAKSVDHAKEIELAIEHATVDIGVAEKAAEDATTKQQQAVQALANASDAKEKAQAALGALQLSEEDTKKAKTETDALYQAGTVALGDLQKLQDSASQAVNDAAAVFEKGQEATATAQTAAEEAQTALKPWSDRMDGYADIPGAAPDTGAKPALDLAVAEAMADDGMFVVFAQGQEITIFRNGEKVETLTRRARDARANISLTMTESKRLAIRYIDESGLTRLESIEGAKNIVFTGDFERIGVSTMVKDVAVFLGAACTADQAEGTKYTDVIKLFE